MSRVQLALNVDDIDEAVGFYTKLFGTEPAKRRLGYANFAVTEPPLKLVLLENPGQGGTLNHLGIEVPNTEGVSAEQARLAAAGLASTDERATTCCYAKQDKFWVEGAPGGESWEIYTVLVDSPTFYGDDTAAAARPDGAAAARPDGTAAARPDGTAAARPDGTAAARRDGPAAADAGAAVCCGGNAPEGGNPTAVSVAPCCEAPVPVS